MQREIWVLDKLPSVLLTWAGQKLEEQELQRNRKITLQIISFYIIKGSILALSQFVEPPPLTQQEWSVFNGQLD
jgi:hypothetical protein